MTPDLARMEFALEEMRRMRAAGDARAWQQMMRDVEVRRASPEGQARFKQLLRRERLREAKWLGALVLGVLVVGVGVWLVRA